MAGRNLIWNTFPMKGHLAQSRYRGWGGGEDLDPASRRFC